MDVAKYILAGYLIDGSGGPIQQRVLLKIENGIITALEQNVSADIVGTTAFTDLSHCTILPPLVDSHMHLFMSGTTSQSAREMQLTADYQDLQGAMRQHLHFLFSHGVLAARDGGDRGSFAVRYRESGDMHSEVILKVAGRAWRQQDRYGRLIGRYPGKNKTLVESYRSDSENVDHVKIVNSGLNSLKIYGKETTPQFSCAELSSLVQAAELQGHTVMVHANGQEPVRMAVEAGCHSIEHGFFMGRKNLALMADKKTFWVPTLFTMKAYAANLDPTDSRVDLSVVEKNLEHQVNQLALARELGVKVALGTDAGSLGVLHGESMVEEMKLYKKAGFTLTEIVQCATSRGAELLGIDEFGLIQPGKNATFLVVRGTPAQLPRKLSYLESIYRNGSPSELYRKNPSKYLRK